MVKQIRKIISIILVVAILGSFAGAFVAQAEKSGESVGLKSEVSATSETPIGGLLANEINESQEEAELKGENAVYAVTVESTTASVVFQTQQKAYLLVCIYEEDGIKMLASGKCIVSSEQTRTDIVLETQTMPDYFLLRAYLIDIASLKPISTVYETPNYTKTVQEFMQTTTADYDNDLVVNLDEDEKKNFMVYCPDVVLVKGDGEHNTLTSIDSESKTYLFENAQAPLSNLAIGDVFSYMIEEEIIVIGKVKDIEETGKTIKIIGEDYSIDEVFEHIKIDTTENEQDSVTHEVGTEQAEVVGELAFNYIVTHAFLDEKNYSKTKDFTQKVEVEWTTAEDDEGNKATISANGELNGWFSYKYIKTKDVNYKELAIDYSAQVQIKLTGQHTLEIPLAAIPPLFVFGVSIHIEFSFYVEYGISFSGTIGISGTIGAMDLNGNTTQLTTRPLISFDREVTGFLSIGFKLKLSGKPLEVLGEISLTGKVGGKLELSKDIHLDNNASVIHFCKNCLKGELKAVASAKGGVEIIGDVLSLKITFAEGEHKICDCHFSFDFKEFGLCPCPHKAYRVHLNVIDGTGQSIDRAMIQLNGDISYTNESGVYDNYLPAGDYTLFVQKEGLSSGELTLNITDEPISSFVIISDKVSDRFLNQYFLNGSFSSDILVYDGHIYKLFTEQFNSFSEAEDYCESKNGHLATIGSEQEDTQVFSYTKRINAFDAYLGMYKTKDGDWIDVLGNKLKYTNWASGEPNNLGGSENVVMYFYTYTKAEWNDGVISGGYYNIVCEWENASDYLRYLQSFDAPSTGTNAFDKTQSGPFDYLFNQKKTYNDLIPNEVYNFYVIKSSQAENILGTANLLYVTQVVSDDSGSASITFRPTYSFSAAEYLMMPIQKNDITQAQVTIASPSYTGEELFVKPVVKFGDQTLQPGVDYYLSGEYFATEGGYYTVNIIGTGAYEGQIPVEYEVHKWDDGVVTKEPTCTGFGSRCYTCEICHNTKTSWIWMLGHQYEFTQTIAPQCEQQGYDIYTCSRCNATIKRNMVEALEHNFVLAEHKASTCNATGYDRYSCTRCDKEDIREIEKLDGNALEAALQLAQQKLAKDYFTEQSYQNLATVYEAHRNDGDVITEQEAVEQATAAIIEAVDALELAQSATGKTEDGFLWQWSKESGELIISGEGAMQDYAIGTVPWADVLGATKAITVQEGISTIGSYAFYGAGGVASVTLPDSLESIGAYAFYECVGLEKLHIPDKVSSIGNRSFYGCSGLKEVSVPAGTVYYTYAFYGAENIQTITITGKGSAQMPDIGSTLVIPFLNMSGVFGPFKYAKSAEVVIDSGVERIGKNSFYGCSGIKKITVFNPICEIEDAQNTISPNTVLCASIESTLKEYAQKYDRAFEDLYGGGFYSGIHTSYTVLNASDREATLIVMGESGTYTFDSTNGIFQIDGYLKEGTYSIYVKPLYGISTIVEREIDSIELGGAQMLVSDKELILGDFNLDGIIDIADISLFLSNIGSVELNDEQMMVYDINADSSIDVLDLAMMLREDTYCAMERVWQ